MMGRAGRSSIGTLVERRSRHVLLFELPERRTAPRFRQASSDFMSTLPEQLGRSLTRDPGKEMAEHVQFTVETGVPVIFCDPRNPWQRGTDENTDGLLGSTCLATRKMNRSEKSRAELEEIARELNGRPRQSLDRKKPSEVSSGLLR